MSIEANYISLLTCPACNQGPIGEEKEKLTCSSCQSEFPIVGQIPWLYKDAQQTKADWQNRFRFFLQVIDSEANALKQALKKDDLLPQTQRRLRHMLQAKVEQAKQVEKLLKPLDLANQGSLSQSIALSVKLPNTQALMSYYANVCRDWVYGEEENKICLNIILEALGENKALGTCVTLGAGACRLSYDLHQATKPDLSLVVDINPYLFYTAKRLLDGKNATIYEFPLAPINLESGAVKLKASAPDKVEDNFHFLFSDAMNPSFKKHAFDTVLTPWLIDIIHQDNREFFKRLNHILKPGARWINFGSLSYFHKDPSICYSLEEIAEIIESSGFTIDYLKQIEIPYLHSPYSAQKRQETIVCFSARKTEDVAQPNPFNLLPEWLLNPSLTIPMRVEFKEQSSIHQTLEFVFKQIDGKSSIKDLAKSLASALGLQVEHSEAMLTNLLAKFVEEKMQGRQF